MASSTAQTPAGGMDLAPRFGCAGKMALDIERDIQRVEVEGAHVGPGRRESGVPPTSV